MICTTISVAVVMTATTSAALTAIMLTVDSVRPPLTVNDDEFDAAAVVSSIAAVKS